MKSFLTKKITELSLMINEDIASNTALISEIRLEVNQQLCLNRKNSFEIANT